MPPTRKDRIEAALRQGLQPTRLEIRDDSAKHRGHAGASPEGETHFHVIIASPRFQGIKPVERQRMMYALLKAEMESGLHALSVEALEA